MIPLYLASTDQLPYEVELVIFTVLFVVMITGLVCHFCERFSK